MLCCKVINYYTHSNDVKSSNLLDMCPKCRIYRVYKCNCSEKSSHTSINYCLSCLVLVTYAPTYCGTVENYKILESMFCSRHRNIVKYLGMYMLLCGGAEYDKRALVIEYMYFTVTSIVSNSPLVS